MINGWAWPNLDQSITFNAFTFNCFRSFESGNFRGFVESKVIPFLSNSLGRPKEDFIQISVFTSQDVDLRILKNDSISRSITG